MAQLELAFLGCFQVLLNGRPVADFKSDKARALLAYLAVEADRPHRREALAGLLWPERADRDALSNLRYTLASLRRTIGDHAATPPFLLITPHTIQFNRASDHWLDVAEVERLIADRRWLLADGGAQSASVFGRSPVAAPRPQAGEEVTRLQSALSLYRGGFLAGFSVGDAAPFEEWALLRREQIGQQVMAALGSLAAYHAARGEYAQAQAQARRQVALEPWSEEAHRILMWALAADGQRNAALHQYQVCRALLRDELGVEPAEETTALYQAIRAGALGGGAGGRESGGAAASAGPLPVQRPSPAPFVAREEPLGRLEVSLHATLAGAGRVVCVVGEAGSGKTALLHEFARRAMRAHADLVVAGGNCNATGGIGDPYLPFREILQLLSGDIEARRAGEALAPEHVRRLWAVLPDAVEALTEVGPDLIGAFVPRADLALRAEAFARQAAAGARPPHHGRLAQPPKEGGGHDAPLQQAALFDQVTRVLQALARRRPLLLVLDDLQWADTGSISLLFHLGRRLTGSRILVAVAYRPDALAAPTGDAGHPLASVVNELRRITGETPIDLDECAGRPFVEALLDAEPNRLGADFREQLLRHTEGHPLFTVELLRGLEERGDLVRDADGRWIEGPALHWETLPGRAEAAIAERIGRLPDRCRMLLAAASVEGEEFTAETVARVLGLDEPAVLQCLSSDLGERHRLVAAVSLRRLGARKVSRYRFRHHLFQQYLYDHLDPVRRVHLHEAVGNAVEQVYGEAPDELEASAPRLAWHFEAAGLADRAAAYHLQAGGRAVRLAAHDEAISHLTRGLALLETLPETPARLRLELDLLLTVLSPYAITRGSLTPEWTRAMERAYALSQHPLLADSPQRGLTLAAAAFFAAWSARPGRARQIGEQFLRMVEDGQGPQQHELAHLVLGAAHTLAGDFVVAHEHLRRAATSYDFRRPSPLDLLFAVHTGVINLGWESIVLWLLGFPDQAAQCLRRTLAAAQESGHRESLIYARTVAAVSFMLLGRDAAAARREIEALWSLHPPHGTGPAPGAWVNSLGGRDPAEDAAAEMHLEQARQGVAASGLMGSGMGRAVQYLLLARSYAQAGQAAAGLGVLDEALAWIEATGVRGFEAEVLRCKGELLLLRRSAQKNAAASTLEAAEAYFRRAIAVARRQGARWWELRAAVSLCRPAKAGSAANRGSEAAERRQEDYRALAELYGRFTEGFDTPDLREARALLDEFAMPCPGPDG